MIRRLGRTSRLDFYLLRVQISTARRPVSRLISRGPLLRFLRVAILASSLTFLGCDPTPVSGQDTDVSVADSASQDVAPLDI